MVQCWGGSRFGEDKMGFGLVVHAMVVGVVLTSGLGVDARALRLMPGRDASVRGVQNGVLTYPIHRYSVCWESGVLIGLVFVGF